MFTNLFYLDLFRKFEISQLALLDFLDVLLRNEARILLELREVIFKVPVVPQDHLFNLLNLDFVDVFDRCRILS